MANTAYLLLGTNLGDRDENLYQARERLKKTVGMVVKASAIYQTAPWGGVDQPAFWNQVLCLETALLPDDLLAGIQVIEHTLGRRRLQRWAARTLDIDILYYQDWVIHTPALTIPHPQIANRRFTLVPLAEIAPDWIHPGLGKTNQELLALCPDLLAVERIP